MSHDPRPTAAPARGWMSAGLFLTTAAIMMLEVALTRILSVVMWYHFAFFAISVALFGLAASGLIVYRAPGVFRDSRALTQCWAAALGLALAAPLAFLMLAGNPTYALFTTAGAKSMSALDPAALLGVAGLYLTGVIPFLIGGLVGSVIFRHHGDDAGRLYAYDLAGAGLGCLATVPVLDAVGGPGAMAVVAVLASAGAAAFAVAAGRRALATVAVIAALLAGVVAVTNDHTKLLHLRYQRGRALTGIQYEKWNSFSRVTVRDFASRESLLIEIDASSNTFLQRWDGKVESLAPLRDGLIATQYALVRQPRVFVIGSGGGIDLLTALAAGARSVTAVEVNPIIVDVMSHRYGPFTGGIYTRPEVKVVNDEARSVIRRSHDRYDVIQAGYVDTYAATAAGAFALTENTLYTREAYEDYLAHLTPDGIIAIQRYYEDPPQQSIRLCSLALAALEKRGDPAPQKHVAVVRFEERASVLVKNSEFTEADVAALEAHCARAGLELIAAPGRPGKGLYGELLGAPDFHRVIAGYDLDISPSSDDRPFFFYVVKPAEFWKGLVVNGGERMNSRAVFLLTALLFVSALLCVLMMVAPRLGRRDPLPPRTFPALGYFAALGLGFMLVEIGVLQRLMLFLGHPALALGVVLTTLLLAAGLGSHWTRGIELARSDGALRVRLVWVMVAIAVVAVAWPPVFRALVALERPWRVLIAVVALAPAGVLLGMAFPLGLRRLAAGRPELAPWAWAVNGATSVLGSVLAMVIAINNGFTVTLLAGALVYVVALLLAPATAPLESRR